MKLALWTALRSLRSRWAALLITVLAVALATATALVVPLVTRQVERGAQEAAQVFDLLVAAKGSPTQALTSSLFYLDNPTGNLPYRVFQDLHEAEGTRHAIPIGLGDNYRGFPVVGTSLDFFQQRLKPGSPPYFHAAQGQLFNEQAGNHNDFEVVLGARVARETGLTLGKTFHGSHGLEERVGEAKRDHTEGYRVVGILAPTGGPVDRAILVPIAAIWEAHGQHDSGREVTAVLYAAEALSGIYTTAQRLNAQPGVMAVFPGQVFAQARDVLLQGQAAYAALSLLVLGIAALTVWLGVQAASTERLRLVALLRALGATRSSVFTLVLLETLLTVTLGVLLGISLSLLLSSVGGGWLGARLGFTLAAPQLTWTLALRALALIPFGLLVALPPALHAMRVSPLRYIN